QFGPPLAVDADSRGTAPGPGRQRADGAAGAAPGDSDSSEDGCPLARLSRTRSRRQRSRRTDSDRLVSVSAGRAVAPADRTGLVVVRGPGRPPLYPGAAR